MKFPFKVKATDRTILVVAVCLFMPIFGLACALAISSRNLSREMATLHQRTDSITSKLDKIHTNVTGANVQLQQVSEKLKKALKDPCLKTRKEQ